MQGRAVKEPQKIYFLELGESPRGAQVWEGSLCPAGLPEPRLCAAFPSKPLGTEAPLPLASDSPCNTHDLGSCAGGKGLRQPCGLQFSSSQARSSSADLRREAGEAGITAGWSCGTSRGNSNKTRVDYIPLETLRKKKKKRKTRE